MHAIRNPHYRQDQIGADIAQAVQDLSMLQTYNWHFAMLMQEKTVSLPQTTHYVSADMVHLWQSVTQ
jgi:hypothetical protein